jgi:hypothetical protein
MLCDKCQLVSISSSGEIRKTRNIGNLVIDLQGATVSSVVIATGYGLDGRGFIPGRCQKFFSAPQSRDRLCGPSIQFVPGLLSPAVNLSEREADYLPLI